jgi:hypothetical protein
MSLQAKTKFLLSFIVLFIFTVKAQNKFQLIGNNKSVTVPFQLKNNLILIPVTINEQKFTFILDTGVSKTLLFNIKANDSIVLNNPVSINIKGLGSGNYFSAIKSTNNFIKIKNIINPKSELYLITEAKFDFSARIGIDVHGLIGADLLKNFIVEIDYVKKKVKFYDPDFFKFKKKKKYCKIPITIHKNKLYISANINNFKKTINLLVDTGSSDSVWLLEDDKIKIPNKNFDDFLGNGLSGEIHGKKAKINSFKIGDFEFKNVLVAFPDSTYVKYSKDGFIRNGIVGGNILKRFKVILDYSNKKIFLKKNSKFKEPFYYNKTGLDISYNGKILIEEKQFDVNNVEVNGNKTIELMSIINFIFKDSFIVSGVKKGSSADVAGIKKGDILFEINGKRSYNYKLDDIVHKLSGNKKNISLIIIRNGIKYKFKVPLIDYL